MRKFTIYVPQAFCLSKRFALVQIQFLCFTCICCVCANEFDLNKLKLLSVLVKINVFFIKCILFCLLIEKRGAKILLFLIFNRKRSS